MVEAILAIALSGELPRGRYVPVDPPAEAFATERADADGLGHLLFLNRCPEGISISHGQVDDARRNRSMIVTGTIHLDPYPYGDASWDAIVDEVQRMFEPFGITVTEDDPGDVPHDEALVCGSDEDAGFAPAAGIAPWGCRPIANAITFTFPEAIGDFPKYTAETVVQEAAHAWALDHSFACEDPMTYLEGCGRKSFQDLDTRCGEYEPRDCACGNATQNTYAYLLDLFGPASAPDGRASQQSPLEEPGTAKRPLAEEGCGCRSTGEVSLAWLLLLTATSRRRRRVTRPFLR
jgi:MYXO-CTERM domain-containing protein